MRKLLLACNGDHFPEGAFEFATSADRKEKILLKGIFSPSVDYSKLTSFAYANAYAIAYERLIPPDFYAEEEELMDKCIAQFEDLCQKHNISYSISKNVSFESLEGLLDETRFSDMLLVENEHFFSEAEDNQPNMEMNRLLHDTECPVFLIPEKLKVPENILFAYDGETSCMAAIKQFGRLVAPLTNLPLSIIFFSFSSGERPPYEEIMTEYIKCHFKNFSIKVVDSENAKNLDKWMAGFSNPLIVTGSYSRSSFSRVFKKSFISTVIANHQFPVFLFHGK